MEFKEIFEMISYFGINFLILILVIYLVIKKPKKVFIKGKRVLK